jgi:Ca-activated chloride channel homolog
MTAVRFDIETDRPLVRKESRTRYVLARIVAPEGQPQKRLPVSLGLVLDRSGSMNGEKIRLAKEAAVSAVRRLQSRDRIAVVFYDDRIDVVVPATAAGHGAMDAAVRAIRDVDARGSTDLCGGWLRACEQLGQVQDPDAVARVLLLTDGLANVGITDPAEIARHAAELRVRGIKTSTIGVGHDFDEHLLGGMADEGGGHFHYVKDVEQIGKAIETEVGETLEVTLRNARLRIGPASVAEVRPLASYPTRRDGDDWVVELGDLVSLQEMAVPLRIAFAPGALSDPAKPAVGLNFSIESGSNTEVDAVVQWRLAASAEVGIQPRNRVVDRAVAEAYASLARLEAGRLNREGEFRAARERLDRTRARIQRYAGDDTFLNDLVRQLERDAVVHAEEMTGAARKASYAVNRAALYTRDPSGGSRRSPQR